LKKKHKLIFIMLEFKETYESALRSLSRREHSASELARKLRAKGFPPEHISQALHELSQQGYLSDIRFTENYARYRLNTGWGPVIIVQELAEKGVSPEVIHQQMVGLKDSWLALACQVRQKKFGNAMPQTFADVVKQKRFLQYRGFTLAQINLVFGGEVE